MRRGTAAFTSNWGSSACRGGIRSSSSAFSFAASGTSSSSAAAAGSRFISSTSSTSISSSSLSGLLKAQRSSANPTPLLNRSGSGGGGGRSSIFASAEQSAAPGGGARSGLYGPRLNASTSTSLLAPLSAAATRAADLATAASKESGEESDEPSSRSRPSATASPPPPQPKPEDDDAKPKLGKVRTFLKKYGAVGVVTYFGLYGATLASFYGAYSSGLLYAGDVVGLIEYLGLGDVFDESLLTPKVGNFALAWVSTKFTEPIRFAITIGITPSISRWWTGHHQHKLEVKREREHQQHQQQQLHQQQEEQEEKERKDKEDKEESTKH